MENKRIYLVGGTGFVGSNLLSAYSGFAMTANSKTVKAMYGSRPDILIYAGVTGTKWYACNHEQEDWEVIRHAKENIANINPKKLILISTVDVYDTLEGVDETHVNDPQKLCIYGRHRLLLEEWVKENVVDYAIIRLPAIYGENLKKNFIYDMIHLIPQVLTEDKIKAVEKDICDKAALENDSFDNKIFDIRKFYWQDREGLYHLNALSDIQYMKLRDRFRNIKNNALSFTNSHSEYQFYNLKNLWNHIVMVIENEIKVINLVTEPVSAGDVYAYIYQQEFYNDSVGEIKYHLRSDYSLPLVGKRNYFYLREEVLGDLKKYIDLNEYYY